MKILVVEDDALFQKVVEQMLLRKGHEVKTASNLETAKILGVSERPDVIIADYRLPDGTGLDLFKKLSQLNVLKPARYVLMSSSFLDVSAPLHEVLKAYNIFCFLHKPFLISELMDALRPSPILNQQATPRPQFSVL